jgi:membrane protease YdiL (CAAX protease family)
MARIISEHIPPQFRPGMIWVYLVFMVILSSYVWWNYVTSSPLERLADPVSAVADSMGPELEYFDGLQELPVWQQKLLNFPEVTRDEFVEEAVTTWRDVISTLQQNPDDYAPEDLEAARAYLLVLLAEERGWNTARSELASWQQLKAPLIDYVISVYDKQQEFPAPEHLFFDKYPDNWATLRLARQDTQVRKNKSEFDRINLSIQQKAAIQVHRTVIYTVVWWSMILIGVSAFVYFYKTVLVTANRYQQAWPLSDAIAVFVLVEILTGILYLIEGDWNPNSLLSNIYFSWPSLWTGLIASLLIYIYLIRPRQVSMRDIFGLRLSRVNGLAPLLLWIIVIFTLDNLGLLMIGMTSDALGFSSPWAEGLSETMLWGEPEDIILEGIDSVLWAPIFEEIVFRGVLYLGIRQYCTPVVAAVLSSAIFSFFHFYTFVGFIEVLWGGLVFALAFEYSRSLLPAIGAHILYNLNWVMYSLIFYRF